LIFIIRLPLMLPPFSPASFRRHATLLPPMLIIAPHFAIIIFAAR
jgi:hypothetical protein